LNIWTKILPWLLLAQLIFSSSATSYVGYFREKQLGKRYGTPLGASLWGVSYWAKSALIAVAIIYGPERGHWVELYAIIGALAFGIGDLGLVLMWSRHQEMGGQDDGREPSFGKSQERTGGHGA
jgi:hypothetical protein